MSISITCVLLLLSPLFLLAFLIFQKQKKALRHFEQNGVKCAKFNFPFGSISTIILKKKTLKQGIIDFYNAFPKSRIFGLLNFASPIYVVRDLELLKQIGIKDFDHFTDHKPIVTAQMDPLFGSNLANMSGQRWKEMRSILTPVFSGAKLRHIFLGMVEVSNDMLKFFREDFGDHTYEMKDVASRYTNDIISNCVFGVKVNSLKDRENPFYIAGSRISNRGGLKAILKFIGYSLFPSVMRHFHIPFLDAEISSYFRNLILKTMDERKRLNISRSDFLGVLMDLKDDQGGQHQFTIDECLGQAFVFFLAGFLTSSNVLSMAIYELAVNYECQKRLIEEIDSNERELDGADISYDELKSLKFMECVINETLRKWPPTHVTDRYCVKDYEVENDEGRRITIRKGESVCFLISGFHYDSQYFENPEKFDPDRFLSENRKNLNAFLPFGIGPRNCIGMRFGVMQVACALYCLLREFTFEVTHKTQIPLQLKKGFGGGAATEKGIWIKFQKREKS